MVRSLADRTFQLRYREIVLGAGAAGLLAIALFGSLALCIGTSSSARMALWLSGSVAPPGVDALAVDAPAVDAPAVDAPAVVGAPSDLSQGSSSEGSLYQPIFSDGSRLYQPLFVPRDGSPKLRAVHLEANELLYSF